MSRRPLRPGTLVGLTEIAALAGGISRQAAHKASNRPDFPRPVDVTAAGPVWRRTAIDRWLRDREARLDPAMTGANEKARRA